MRASCISCGPDRVRIIADDNGWPLALNYGVGAQKRTIPLDEGRGLHLKLFHPLDDHYGFAPLEAALMALDIHNASGSWNKALLDNSARPSGALVYAPGETSHLTEDQFERLKGELEEGYGRTQSEFYDLPLTSRCRLPRRL